MVTAYVFLELIIYLFIYLKSMTEGPEGHLYCQKYTKYTEYTTQIKQRKKDKQTNKHK